MTRISAADKKRLVDELVSCLKREREIVRIVVFGSFVQSDSPHDMDVAIFQDSAEGYLPLAMKYREKTRRIADDIALDIIPIRPNAPRTSFLMEIERGNTVYER
ncbi:nucleotidyltransferase domain-containing protein [Desulfolutivibrio sulfoxidireducens]|uniref:nucleotidyltransferase domain-containing protein n=1 Tax=Desulfolutivibrio sulfoxidireducens TaxID=2773299 RepID=UPI00159E9C2C|nr:nucleotidyltransferase domain-containing protein [Desulfolutivibrio sulfoxidireducens]QLA15213.1 nucleotidyltransferase domain-containing protein [Desulfolutivibrio sulfoxidireducens]QLA18782.1 nucleotidyltransferase domain-containing protein [Desulfolutivibrio sulfoxidireducens]